uniref:COP9 signalosome complex subunit 3 N-terminal helical repeats domain-containing protein n=1 Tax=Timema shepardi TaxID=629360 RepID=A0A7R9FYE1_TIMSH|nr:unnamed protein product [Timema shepardi]
MASGLEQFVNNVRSLSAQGNFRELCEQLSKLTEVLMKNSQHLDNVLETLDLQQHSLGVLAVLCVKLSLPAPSATPDHHEILFAQVQEFITGCNGEQVRFAPDTCYTGDGNPTPPSPLMPTFIAQRCQLVTECKKQRGESTVHGITIGNIEITLKHISS